VRYGGKTGKRYSLAVSDDRVVVRTRDRGAVADTRPFEVAALSAKARRTMADFELEVQFRDAGVEVWRALGRRARSATRDSARSALKQEPAIEFAGRVLIDSQSKRPVIYTENFFVKFDGDEKPSDCRKLLSEYNLKVKRELEYARNAYFVAAPDDTGLAIFDIAEKLLKERSVELCHPELIREARQRKAFAQQWHLNKTRVNGSEIDAHANVEAAWALSDGSGAIIAIIDNGVDLDHEEFRSSGKIVAPRDVTRGNNNPRPGNRDHHGTACAGVAGADGNFGAAVSRPGPGSCPSGWPPS